MNLTAVAKRARNRDTESAGTDMSVLESKLGYRIRMAERFINREFLLHAGMTPVQYSVFSLVATNVDLSQVAIGEALNMDRASTMAIVHKLEMGGLIERHKSPHDGRMHALRLTKKGEKEFPRVNQRVQDHDDTFRNRLSRDEMLNLLSYLDKLRG